MKGQAAEHRERILALRVPCPSLLCSGLPAARGEQPELPISVCPGLFFSSSNEQDTDSDMTQSCCFLPHSPTKCLHRGQAPEGRDLHSFSGDGTALGQGGTAGDGPWLCSLQGHLGTPSLAAAPALICTWPSFCLSVHKVLWFLLCSEQQLPTGSSPSPEQFSLFPQDPSSVWCLPSPC